MNWITVVINGQEVSIAIDGNSVHVYNAFRIKDDLKMRGYRWNPTDKSWYISPSDIDAEVEVLKNNLQVPDTTSSSVPVQGIGVSKSPGSKAHSGLPESYSVADLRNRLDRLIREGIRGNIWVRGIIASDIKHYKWASYMDLKDEDQNREIFFRMEIKKKNLEKIESKIKASGIAQSLERDLPVFCNVEVHLPLRYVVDVRLNLLDILPEYTQSRIRNQREITLETLKKEGILENQKKLVMPAIISRIGLITSEQGTSLRDIKAGLYPYGSKYDFYFADSRMEGANAVDSIIQAISQMEENSSVTLDAIIIARGGGSEQSLAVFNDLRLCRKVCLCGIPVLTAIGHEKDVAAIELCSWLTPIPSTPSGIGKYLQNRFLELRDQFTGTITGLIHRFATLHQREIEKLNGFIKNIPARASAYINWREERFSTLRINLSHSVRFTVSDHQRRIRTFSRQVLSRSGDFHARNRQGVQSTIMFILTRSKALRVRESGQVARAVTRLDFQRRFRLNARSREELEKKAALLVALGRRQVDNAYKELEVRIKLVNANDLEKILDKGFTLTLDQNFRVIKSLAEFKQKGQASLRFHDGSTGIKEQLEEEK